MNNDPKHLATLRENLEKFNRTIDDLDRTKMDKIDFMIKLKGIVSTYDQHKKEFNGRKKKIEELTNLRLETNVGTKIVKAPLIDETFMSHSIPNMNMYEYKGEVSTIKRMITRTAHAASQTSEPYPVYVKPELAI